MTLAPGTLVYVHDWAGARLGNGPVRVTSTFTDRFGNRWVVLDSMSCRYLEEQCCYA